MGLREDIRDAISGAWPQFDTIRKACTLHRMGTLTYDPVVGTEVEVGGVDHDVLAIWSAFAITEVDGSVVLSTDKKAMIPADDLAVTPEYDDYIIDADSVRWTVRGVNIDPADALWILHVRLST